VNKILGLLVLALAFTLTLGTMGCNTAKDKKEDEKKAAEGEKKKKEEHTKKKEEDKKKADDVKDVELKLKTTEGKLTLKKTGKIDFVVELDEDAPADLVLKASAKDTKDEILSGAGKIEKGKKKGTVEINTKDAPATLKEFTIDITGEKVKAAAIKVTIEKVEEK